MVWQKNLQPKILICECQCEGVYYERYGMQAQASWSWHVPLHDEIGEFLRLVNGKGLSVRSPGHNVFQAFFARHLEHFVQSPRKRTSDTSLGYCSFTGIGRSVVEVAIREMTLISRGRERVGRGGVGGRVARIRLHGGCRTEEMERLLAEKGVFGGSQPRSFLTRIVRGRYRPQFL